MRPAPFAPHLCCSSAGPEDDFEKLFGAEAAKVSHSGSKKDDAAFAAKLLQAARDVPDAPDFQALLLEKTVEFASRDPLGDAAAIEALELLASNFPAKRDSSLARILALLESRFENARKGDRPAAGERFVERLVAVATSMEQGNRWQEAAQKLEQASAVASAIGSADSVDLRNRAMRLRNHDAIEKRRLRLLEELRTTGDRSKVSTELCVLYVTELDDPVAATAFAKDTGSATIVDMLALAARAPTSLSEADALRLADWYRGLAPAATTNGKGFVLRRAAALYEHYLATHTARDIERLKVSMAQKEVTEALQGFAENAPTKRATFFGASAVGTRFVFIVDTSGSMQGPKLSILKSELIASLDALAEGAMFCIIPFSSEAKVLGDRVQWTTAHKAGRRRARDGINEINAFGGTNPQPAFDMMFELDPAPDAVFFLSDGLFDAEVSALIARKNRRPKTIPIHAIGFDMQDTAAIQILERIAQESKGTFTAVKPGTGEK